MVSSKIQKTNRCFTPIKTFKKKVILIRRIIMPWSNFKIETGNEGQIPTIKTAQPW